MQSFRLGRSASVPGVTGTASATLQHSSVVVATKMRDGALSDEARLHFDTARSHHATAVRMMKLAQHSEKLAGDLQRAIEIARTRMQLDLVESLEERVAGHRQATWHLRNRAQHYTQQAELKIQEGKAVEDRLAGEASQQEPE